MHLLVFFVSFYSVVLVFDNFVLWCVALQKMHEWICESERTQKLILRFLLNGAIQDFSDHR